MAAVPVPLSLDLRIRIVHACEAGEQSQSEIADVFEVHRKTVEKYWRLPRRGQSLAPKPHAGGRCRHLSGHEEQVRAVVAEPPDATLAEWAQLLAERHQVQARVSLLSRTLTRWGLSRKKSL